MPTNDDIKKAYDAEKPKPWTNSANDFSKYQDSYTKAAMRNFHTGYIAGSNDMDAKYKIALEELKAYIIRQEIFNNVNALVVLEAIEGVLEGIER